MHMGRTPRHAGGSESALGTLRALAREAVWNGDTLLLAVVLLGIVIWPWLGTVSLVVYMVLP